MTRRLAYIADTYRWVHAHPVGRWLLAVVWAGLGCATAGILAYVPLLLERRELVAAAGGVLTAPADPR